GFASGNPKNYQKYQARLKTLQRRLARKKKGSNNRYKAKLKVAKLHAKIADCRKDCLGARSLGRGTRPGSHRFLHKLSTKLVRENQSIFTETLAVKNMMANHKLAKAIADCGATPRRRQAQGNAHQESGWGEFLRQLQYSGATPRRRKTQGNAHQEKCNWHDRNLVAIDRWFPSSKRCHSCGHVLDQLSLDVREWQCPSCQKVNLRDLNAALNILAVGQTVSASGLSSDGDITSVSLVNLG
ncbi:MAG: zinc ribbon domain-containing protein, partial [Xenococcus sp. (in: cyanobacteria)]